jgi:hypothetical protein
MPRPAEHHDHSFEDMHACLSYDEDTGLFHWKKQTANIVKIGMPAGCINRNGYVHILLGKKTFKAHRLALFMKTGRWPKFVDHINGIKTDNRWSNLREVLNEKENQQNRRCHRAGVLWGTSFHRKTGTYSSRVNLNGKIHSMGYHKTREEAHRSSVEFAERNGIRILRRNEHVNEVC